MNSPTEMNCALCHPVAICLNCENDLDLRDLYDDYCPVCKVKLGIRRGFWGGKQW